MGKKTRAAIFREFGEPGKVEIGSHELPDLKEGEVLVKIKAAGVNPVDAIITSGKYKDRLPHSLPLIPGWDMAGIIEDRGHAARRFEKGDEVYAYARRPEVKWGTFAEYIVIPESYLAKRPENLTWEESAAIPLAALTAYQSLYTAGNLKEGEKLLIIGASGGVGSFAIQLARIKGAEVIGVASKENHHFMKQLGAQHCIDYKDADIGKAAGEIWKDGADLIFDCTGGDSLQQSLKALKKSGKLVSIKSQGDKVGSDIDFEFVFVEPHSKQLEHLREMAQKGSLRVEIMKAYPLEETAMALEQISTLHTTGKIVIVP